MIQAIHAGNLMHFANYLGIQNSEINKLLTDSNKDICNPEEWISESEYLAIYSFIYAKSKDTHFGLKFGTFLNIRSLGLIAEISKHATNIQQAITICSLYLDRTFKFVKLTTGLKDSFFQIIVHSSISDITLKNQILDTLLCYMYRELATILPKGCKLILEVPREDVLAFQNMLQCNIQTGIRHCILLDQNILKQDFSRDKGKHLEILLPKFLALLEEGQGHQSFSSKVRRMVFNVCTPELPDISTVASCLFISERTLQRKLQNEGANFRSIMQDIKQELTHYLSFDKKLKKREIAEILGYQFVSSLIHAEKKW